MRLLTTLELAGNYPQDILITATEQGDKWRAFCYLTRNGEIHKLMLSTTPIFKSEKIAIKSLTDIAEQCVKEYGDTTTPNKQ